ncbi:hypothetical protein L596_000129 [Steinernema carpocapsae]|uniref:Uncharacterized protein n=1 Tax=Steinernema carpocapsae TaxID=34508 RepID=A0A4V6I708_STECR|nr:hypothetical protein L596_000129 [Steinernema carpocapsae]
MFRDGNLGQNGSLSDGRSEPMVRVKKGPICGQNGDRNAARQSGCERRNRYNATITQTENVGKPDNPSIQTATKIRKVTKMRLQWIHDHSPIQKMSVAI